MIQVLTFCHPCPANSCCWLVGWSFRKTWWYITDLICERSWLLFHQIKMEAAHLVLPVVVSGRQIKSTQPKVSNYHKCRTWHQGLTRHWVQLLALPVATERPLSWLEWMDHWGWASSRNHRRRTAPSNLLGATSLASQISPLLSSQICQINT